MKKTIAVLVADLRTEPQWLQPHDFSHNPLRLSQLNLGEEVEIYRREGDWLFIGALEQLVVDPLKGWIPYPGWVHETEVGEQEKSFSAKDLPLQREKILSWAESQLGTPYLWGGCAPHQNGVIASVDCSGLTYLAFKAQGKLIPRNAHDQYIACRKIAKEALLPGDLIFWEPVDKPGRITHVVFFKEREHYLEAPESGKNVRLLPLPELFWQEESIEFPFRSKSYKTYCGTFCHQELGS